MTSSTPSIPTAAESLIGKTLADYAVEAKLGSGGFGAVFIGRHLRTGRRYALKVLRPDRALVSPDARQRFRREAEALSSLGHIGIVQIHDYASENGVDFLVMDLLEGEDLAARLARGPLTPARAREIAAQVADALQAAHSREFVHRDLKPANIFLAQQTGDQERAVLLDFGLAKSVAEGAPSLTGSAEALGTPQYMAPEQATGESVDPRVDVYGLAAITFEMLTGQPPFTGQSAASILLEVMTVVPPRVDSLVDVPATWADAIARGLDKDRTRRFDDVGAFIDALDGEVGGLAAASAVPQTRVLPRSSGGVGGVRSSDGALQQTSLPVSSVRPPPPTAESHAVVPARSGHSMGRMALLGALVGLVALGLLAVVYATLHAPPDSPVAVADGPPEPAETTTATPTVSTAPDREVVPAEADGSDTTTPSDSEASEIEAESAEVGAPPPEMPPSPHARQSETRARQVETSMRPPPRTAPNEETTPVSVQSAPTVAVAPVGLPPAVSDANRMMITQYESQIEAMRELLQFVGPLRTQLQPLSRGREPVFCNRRPGLPRGSEVPLVVSSSQRLRSLIDDACTPFEQGRNPPDEARSRIAAVPAVLDRSLVMAQDRRLSSNEPVAIAEEVEAAIGRARTALDGVVTGSRPFPCDDPVWADLRRLSNAGNSWSGAAAQRVWRAVDRSCQSLGLGRSRLSRVAERGSETLDSIEGTLNGQIRTLERVVAPLRVMVNP